MAAAVTGVKLDTRSCGIALEQQSPVEGYPIIQDPADIIKICILDTNEIQEKVAQAKDIYSKNVRSFLEMSMDNPSACVKAFEESGAYIIHLMTLCRAMNKVHATPAIQRAFLEGQKQLDEAFFSEAKATRQSVYEKLQRCENHASLDKGQKYYLGRVLTTLRAAGCHKGEVVCEEIYTIKEAIREHIRKFNENRKTIREPVKIQKEDLIGTPKSVIDRLKKEGEYYSILLDESTVFLVLEHCPNQKVRDAVYKAYRNIGYCNYSNIDIAERHESVNNMNILQELIKLRQQWADLAGYESYADLEASQEVLQNAKEVEQFLLGILETIKEGQQVQYEALKEEFPDSVISGKEKFRACDTWYLVEQYVQRKYGVDTNKLRDYFPLKATMGKMIGLFKELYNVGMEKVEVGPLWAEGVEVYRVTSLDNPELHGYVAFDLYARKGKEAHVYYSAIVNGNALSNSPTFGVVIGNFVRDEKAKEALLTPREVYSRLLHESAHAIQHVLGRKTISVHSMQEYPSMILEEWGKDFHNLRRLSSHYENGEPIDSAMCDYWNKMERFKGLRELGGQISLALLMLRCFLKDEEKDIHRIEREVSELAQPYYEFDELIHLAAGFPHIASGSDYYKYPLAGAIACTVLEQIKKEGFFGRFVKEVLMKGRSEDPLQLIERYLGRPWSL